MPRTRHPVVVGASLAASLGAASMILFWAFGAGGGGVTPTTSLDGALATIVVTTSAPDQSTTVASEVTTTTALPLTIDPLSDWGDARLVGEPYGTAVDGLLTFRGNPSRTYYGKGPVPDTPTLAWRYPETPMCSTSTDLGVTSTWCGNGWTGQPVVWEREDDITEVIFGAYDGRLHFVDAETGTPTRSPILTGDLIKGTPTIDPDGFPIVYVGSRDNKIRAIALDRSDPIVLWEFDATGTGRWNDDWDASPLVVNDYMFEGSENSIFYIFRLHRGYDGLGLVTIAPEVVFEMETWTDQLLADIGAEYPATSVENSAVMYEGRVYFANSGGRVIGLDITGLPDGDVEVVFDYWMGDDVDATIVVDEQGYLYVAAEYERYLPRAREVGQLVKLDPYDPDDPWVWGMFSLTDPPAKGGLWSTPALGDGVLYAVTHKGYLVAVDQETGEEIWVFALSHGSWSSPAIVDGQLVVASSDGLVRRFNLANPRQPRLVWSFQVGEGAIESTPAVWEGKIFIGSRDGYVYAIEDAPG